MAQALHPSLVSSFQHKQAVVPMAEDKAKADSPPPKSKKRLFIILASVLVLGGGGAGAWFAFAGKAEPDAAQADKAGKGDKAEPETKLPAQFIEMDPPFVVNFQPGSQARFLQVAVQLMTRDVETAALIEHVKPIVRNDLLSLFGNKQVAEVATPEGKEALRVATLDAVRQIIAAEGGKSEALEAVYFTSFVMQ
jgi:flagellar FliL protein